MARGRPYRFARFARGLNTTDGPYGLRDGYEDDPSGLGSESRSLLNVVSKDRGNVRRRDGCVSIGDLGAAIDTERLTSLSVIGSGISSFAVASTTAGRLLALDTGQPATVTELATGLSTSAPWVWRRAPTGGGQGPAFGMNGTDAPRYTDGTLAGTGLWTADLTLPSSLAAIPNGTLMAWWKDSLWVSGVAANPDRVYWTGLDPATMRNFPLENDTDFGIADGLDVTAICALGPYLLVFKKHGMWTVYDAVTSANRKQLEGVGTNAPGSVVATERGCFFLDPSQGVMLTDGSTAHVVSPQITATLNAIPDADLALASAAYVDGHYQLTVPSGGTHLVFDYDAELGSWWIHSPAMTCLASWDRGAGDVLVGAHATRGQAWELFKEGEVRDDGTIFESWWSGPWHTFSAAHLRKRCRKVHLDGRGVLDVYMATEYDVSRGNPEGRKGFLVDEGTFGGAGVFGGGGLFGGGHIVGEDNVLTLGVARAWSFSVYSATDIPWELDAYTMLMDVRKD